MGHLKDREAENDGLHRIAEEIAVQVGLLSRCPFCNTTYDPLMWTHVQAYRLGNALISRKDSLVTSFEGDRRRLTDMLQHIEQGYPNGCDCGACGRS